MAMRLTSEIENKTQNAMISLCKDKELINIIVACEFVWNIDPAIVAFNNLRMFTKSLANLGMKDYSEDILNLRDELNYHYLPKDS